MFKMMKKALAITLSLALLASTILVGGIFAASATSALTGTTMPSTYTFDFDNVTSYEVLDYANPGEAGQSTDQYGKKFYVLTGHADNDTINVAGNTVEYNGETVSTVRIANLKRSLNRYIPTDEYGYPYLMEPNSTYKVTITYYDECLLVSDRIFAGFGASNPYSGNVKLNNWCWQTKMYKEITNLDGTVTSTDIGGLDEYGHLPIYLGAPYADVYHDVDTTAKPLNFKTETRVIKTGDFTLDNGTFKLEGFDVAPYFCVSLNLGWQGNTGERSFQIDKITIEKEVSVTLDANGGYFGDYDALNPTTLATAKGLAGVAFKPTVPSHPDPTVKFYGWALDGEYVDTTVFSDRFVGKTLKAIWTDEQLTYTFNFNEGEVKDATYGTAFVDQYGNTFYPWHRFNNETQHFSVAQQNIAGTHTGDIGALVLTHGDGNAASYIPTDANGKPYIIEPNTEYTVNIKAYLAKLQTYAGIAIGGGAYGAFFKDTSTSSGTGSLNDFYIEHAGLAGGSENLVDPSLTQGFYPLYRAHKQTSAYETGTRPRQSAFPDGGISHWGSYALGDDSYTKARYRDFTLPMKTGNFNATNGRFQLANANGTTYEFGQYFTIGIIGDDVVAIDSITINKVVSDVTVNFDANGGSFGDSTTTSATLTPGTAINVTAPTRKGARFVGWSWYKDGAIVDTATSGMAGKTLYAVWEAVGSATLNANGGYFGNYAAEGATVTEFIDEYQALASVTPNHPDASTTFVGWMLDGEMVTSETVTKDMVDKTLYAVWAGEDNTYTFDFDTVKEFGLLTYNVPANAASVDQYGQTFYPFVSYDTATTTAFGNTVEYNGENVTTLKFAGINHSMLRYIPTDANGLPYIVKPNTQYKVDVTYYAENWYATDNLYFGAGASLAYSNNIKQGTWCWLVAAAKTITRYYPDGTSETGNLASFDEWGYHPESIGMVGKFTNGAGMGVAFNNMGQTNPAPVNFKTESVYFTTSDFTQAADGSYTWDWTGGYTWKTAPYFCVSYGQSYDQAHKGKPRDFQIDKIVITEIKDDVTVTFDANGGAFDGEATLSADVTPGSDIEVTAPTRKGYKLAGWSWYKDAVVDANVATTGMAGKTLYAVWAPAGSANLNANGGYFGDYVAENATTTGAIYVGEAFGDVVPNYPDASTTFVGWMHDGKVYNAEDIVTEDMAEKTFYAVWAKEDISYTFDFDTVNEYSVLNYTNPGESGKSTDQFGNKFYPLTAYDAYAPTATGNTVVYNGQNVSTVRISDVHTYQTRYIPTDENGLPFIAEPNKAYSISVTYYAENMFGVDCWRIGFGASNPYSGNVKQGNWCWLGTQFPQLMTLKDGTTNEQNGDSYSPSYLGETLYNGWHGDYVETAAPVNFVTETVLVTTGDFTLDNGKFQVVANGASHDVAPYLCLSFCDTNYSGTNPRNFQIDKIVVTEVKDDVTVNFDANGGTLDTTTAALTPGCAIDVEPTHSNPAYKFVGWSWYKDADVRADVVTTGMNGKTLYAVWTEVIPVTFNANGGDIAGQGTVTNYYNDGDAITAPTPTRKYYDFVGWAESADSNATVTIPANATFDMIGKTYYAVWKAKLHGEYDTFTRVIDYSKYTVNSGGDGKWLNNASPTCNTWVAVDNVNYPWNSIGKTEAGSADGYYLHYKSPQNVNGVDEVPGGWAPHYSLIMTETGYHNNSGDMAHGDNLYLPENTSFRVTIRMKTVVLDGKSLNFRIGYGPGFATTAFTNVLTGVGPMEDWTDVSFVFTTPASYTEGQEKCILNIVPATTSTALEYMIDTITLERVTATTLYTVENGVATEAKTLYGVPGTNLVLPTKVSSENYNANGTATVSTTPIASWYADNTLATAAVTKFANIDTAIYGKVEGETTTTSTINQNLYCGFDSYAMNASVAGFITNEDAYTGDYSAKAVNLTDIEVRNTNDFMLKAGKTYKVTLAYKTIDKAAISVGISNGTNFVAGDALALTADGNWNTVTTTITADYGMDDGYVLVLRAKGVYIDNVVVSSVTDVIGAFTDDDTNIRFMMGYNLTGDKIVIEGVEYTITERGVAIKGEGSEKDVIKFTRTSDFIENCWNYDETTGALVYSANIKLDGSFESNKVVARGYVTLDDGTTFYTDYISASREDVTSVDALVGDAFVNDLYVYLPEGTELAADVASTATFYNLFLSGEVVVDNVLENNTMKFGAYAKFSAAPAEGTIVVPDEVKYLVHSGTYDELCAGVDAYVASYKLDQVGEDAVNYVFITDLHFDNNNPEVTKQVELITNMANNDDSIDMVVVGGDITTGMFTTKAAAIEATQTAIAPLQNCTKPVIVLRGNHDDNTYLSENDKAVLASRTISDIDWNENVVKFVNNEETYSQFVHNTANENSAYFYYDIEKNGKTTRVIALNACDQDLIFDEDGNVTVLPVSVRSWEITDGLLTEGRTVTYGAGVSMYGYSSRQMKWLAEEALNGFDGDIIVLSHMGTDGHAQSNSSVTPVKNSEALNKILNAYQTKGTYNGTLYDELADVYNLETREYTARAGVKVSADFSATDGKILIYQYGHTHIEMMTYYAAANIWEINTATSNYVNAPKDYDAQLNKMNKGYPWNIATKDQRTANNDTACFDIVSAGSKVVYKFNVGFGDDATMVVPR